MFQDFSKLKVWYLNNPIMNDILYGQGHGKVSFARDSTLVNGQYITLRIVLLDNKAGQSIIIIFSK